MVEGSIVGTQFGPGSRTIILWNLLSMVDTNLRRYTYPRGYQSLRPLQDGVLSEREFKKFFECFLRYAFFDVVMGAQGTAEWIE